MPVIQQKFCINSTPDVISMMDAVAEIGGMDRHELIHQLLYQHIISTIQSDATAFIDDDDAVAVGRVHQLFG
jgi:hypothetical protein